MKYLLFLFFGIFVYININAQTLERQVISSSGGTYNNVNLLFDFTIGETVINTFQNSGLIFIQGFQQPNIINCSDTVIYSNKSICSGQTYTVGSHTYSASGIYHDTLQTTAGCDSIIITTLTINPQVSITVNTLNTICGQHNGSATAIVTSGTAPFHYLWNMGDTTNAASNLNIGVYIVYVTDANGCQNSETGVVSSTDGPVISNVQISPVSCFGGSNGAITITVTGGTLPYHFEWSNGDTLDQNISNLTAGPYEIIVTDANNCQSISSINVTQPAQLSVSIAVTNATCGNSDGEAVATITGGTQPYIYIWSNGNSTANNQSLSADGYSLTVVDSQSCAVTASAIITESGSATVTIDSLINPVCSGNNGKIYISVSGGSIYTYDWSDGSHNQDLIGVSAGTYSVTVSNGTGCNAVTGATLNNFVPVQQPICIVTTDGTTPATNKNMEVWEKQQTEGISHYKLYKETTQANVYHNIATIPYANMSTYTDQLSNPHSRAYRYKISAVDSCGNESELSFKHKTIHLVVSLGQGNDVNLIWNHYEGFTFDSYFIYRKCLGTPWEVIDTLPGNLNTYTNTPPCSNVNVKYRIAAVRGYECWASDNSKSQTGPFSQSLSNIEDNGIIEPVGVQQNESDNLNCKIYPNPTHDKFTIDISTSLNVTANSKIEIIDLQGRIIKSVNLQNSKTTIDLHNYYSGIYTVRIITDKEILVKKLIKQ